MFAKGSSVIELIHSRWASGRTSAAVYGWLCAPVKRIIALTATLTLTGCAPLQPTVEPVQQAALPVGMWYSVELAATSPAGLRDTLQRDFDNFATMGLDLILVQHCTPTDIADVIEIAGNRKLHLIVADPVAEHYLRSGSRRSGWFAPPAVVPQRHAVVARYVGRVVDMPTLQRAIELADVAKRAGLPLAVEVDARMADRVPPGTFAYVFWHDTDDPQRYAPADAVRGGVRTVACIRGGGGEQHAVRAWLAEYHLGLAQAETGGVVFDTFRALPASPRGVVVMGEALTPERIAMIRRIADRCRRWHELLAGLGVHDARSVPVREVDVRVAVLASPRRQCLLVVNPSADKFARGQLTLNAAMAANAFDRAVSATTSEDTMVGAVYHVTNNRLEIPVTLAPGEAELYELF